MNSSHTIILLHSWTKLCNFKTYCGLFYFT